MASFRSTPAANATAQTPLCTSISPACIQASPTLSLGMNQKKPVVKAECQEPAASDRLPVHRSESPTGYSSAGCSPAEPASASPVTDNSSSIPIRRGNQMRRSTSLQGCRPACRCNALSHWSCPPPTECHLYFAHRVTFLASTDKGPRSTRLIKLRF
jgi:hypothetical protein